MTADWVLGLVWNLIWRYLKMTLNILSLHIVSDSSTWLTFVYNIESVLKYLSVSGLNYLLLVPTWFIYTKLQSFFINIDIRIGFNNQGITISVNPNNCWPNFKWLIVLFSQIQLICMFRFRLTIYSAFKIPDKLVWNIYNFAWNILDLNKAGLNDYEIQISFWALHVGWFSNL